ncbi:uncharacterized protein [Rutidosis leptorrhynchoides]|uniref:uncharacterized protein n=1 Tax=Rutidosis leptorrhynchoides TaxID=125765 RepID=UPI003A99F72A
MWNMLETLVTSERNAWVICGDFNEVRDKEERFNCVFHEYRAENFNDFIERTRLIDIPLGGRKYTRLSDDGIKFSKLDRFLVSEEFHQLWRDLSSVALEREWSDHCPIILRDKINDFGPKPFKIFDEWFNVNGEDDVIIEAWNIKVDGNRLNCIFRNKLKNVKYALKNWSRENFSNLNVEINELKKNSHELGIRR